MLHSFSGTSPHFFLEALGYFIGTRIYWRASRHTIQPEGLDRWLIIAAAVFGAFVGSKLLHLFEHAEYLLQHTSDLSLWFAGKSVLGGFLGGTLSVELMKRAIGWKHSTGDVWVPALAAGLMIGRLGCQFSGMWDLTYGVPTSLPWGWDYGDSIARHPVGLYEILLIGSLFGVLHQLKITTAGTKFNLFMLGYCVIRIAIDFLKPPFFSLTAILPVTLYGGITAIQWAGIIGAIYFLLVIKKRHRQ